MATFFPTSLHAIGARRFYHQVHQLTKSHMLGIGYPRIPATITTALSTAVTRNIPTAVNVMDAVLVFVEMAVFGLDSG